MAHLSPPTLTESEQQAILAATAVNRRDHTIYSLALGTGLRLAEIVGLDVGDVYAPDGTPRSRVRIRPERRRLSAHCRRNQPIVRAYYLKESFQKFWDYMRPGWSEPDLKQWLWWASHSRLHLFKRFARMIREHLDGIPACTLLRVSNSALEGMNNKIKAVSNRAFGYSTTGTYTTAIWHGCGGIPPQ